MLTEKFCSLQTVIH